MSFCRRTQRYCFVIPWGGSGILPQVCTVSPLFLPCFCVHSLPRFVVVQLLSFVWLFATPWAAACPSSLSFTVSPFAQTHVHWVDDAIQTSHPVPLFSSCPHSFPASGLLQWVGSWCQYFLMPIAFDASISLGNIVNIPKTHQIFSSNVGSYQSHDMTWDQKCDAFLCALKKKPSNRKNSYGCHAKHVF